MRRIASKFHIVATAILAAALVHAFRAVGLPLRFDWQTYLRIYWIGLAFQSIFAATLLYILEFPVQETIGPMWVRFQREKLLLPLLIVPVVLLFYFNGPWAGLVLSVDAIAIIEWITRSRESRTPLATSASAPLLPAIYFFFGFILVLSYNDVIAALRFDGSWDAALNRIDSWLMFGTTVTSMAHAALAKLPLQAIQGMEWIYVLMFPQLGASMILLALLSGRKRAIQFVAALLTGYYLALILFFLIPTTGPYYLCREHFARFPDSPWYYQGQRPLLDAFRSQRRPNSISLDYLIGFPCMHVAQPLIALWYLRRWKRITAILVAFDVVLVPAILLLEQHYVVDLIGGVVVAGLAIGMTSERERSDASSLVAVRV